MFALIEGAHLPARDPHVPHASPGQNLDGIPLVVIFAESLVNGSHAARAQSVDESVRSQDQSLSFALQQSFGLELAQDALIDEKLGQGRRLGGRLLSQKLIDQLVQMAAIYEVAAPQIPNKPFTSSQFGDRHKSEILKLVKLLSFATRLMPHCGGGAGDSRLLNRRKADGRIRRR